MPSDPNRAVTVEALYRQAAALFGPERAEVLRPSLEQRAEQLRLLASVAPDPEDEPIILPLE